MDIDVNLSTRFPKEYEELEEERFEVIKGDVRTIIICKFNRKGYLVSSTSVAESLESPIITSLKDELFEAILKGKDDEICEVQDRINRFREVQENRTKPTL